MGSGFETGKTEIKKMRVRIFAPIASVGLMLLCIVSLNSSQFGKLKTYMWDTDILICIGLREWWPHS